MGDDQALQAVIDANHGRLVGLLRLRGASAEEADDLAQDTMVRLVQHWSTGAEVQNWWAWLVTVALNLQRSHWRRLAMIARKAALTRPTVEHRDAETAEVLDLLAGLTERQRTAVVLRHFAGLSIRETAAVMGVAEGTVKSLDAAGRAKARRQAEAAATHAEHESEVLS